MTTPVEIKKTEKFSVLEAVGSSTEAEKPAAPAPAADGQKQNQGKKKCESFIIHLFLLEGDGELVRWCVGEQWIGGQWIEIHLCYRSYIDAGGGRWIGI